MITKSSKILIVDDFEIARFMVQKILIEIGFTNLSVAKDGLDALEMIESAEATAHPYQLVLSDWNMPRMTGIELLTHCREHPHLRDLPFIIFTSEMEENALQQVLRMGASDYIMKPFKKETFLEKTKNLRRKNKTAA